MKTNLEHNGVVRDPHLNAKFHLTFWRLLLAMDSQAVIYSLWIYPDFISKQIQLELSQSGIGFVRV